MKKHILLRAALLLVGFLLIYVYVNWETWLDSFSNSNRIGGKSGMSPAVDFVLNSCWIIIWNIMLIIEMLTFFLTSQKDKKRGIANLLMVIVGIAFLIIYVSILK